MHDTTSPTPAIDAIVAATRAHAHLASRLLRRLDPFRNDPGVAHVSDLCAVLEGPYLLREDTVQTIEGLAARVAVKLEQGMRQGRPAAPLHEALETLYTALLDTVETARSLEALVLGGDGHAAGTFGG